MATLRPRELQRQTEAVGRASLDSPEAFRQDNLRGGGRQPIMGVGETRDRIVGSATLEDCFRIGSVDRAGRPSPQALLWAAGGGHLEVLAAPRREHGVSLGPEFMQEEACAIDLNRQVVQIVETLSRFSTSQAASALSDQQRVSYFELPVLRNHSAVLLN